VTANEHRVLAEDRREAGPVALVLLLVFVALATVSGVQGWQLLHLHWWTWLVVAIPATLLAIDLMLTQRGSGLVRSRKSAVVLLGILVLANLAAVAILVTGLLTTSTEDLTGAELLFTAIAIWLANVIVFGLLFWEFDAGGPGARARARSRTAPDFFFPQDGGDTPPGRAGWRPQVWDYLYVSLTNSIAFSPTDTMPLSLGAKATMGLESAIAGFTILLVFARAVNVISN
jgi:hypothetical protein